MTSPPRKGFFKVIGFRKKARSLENAVAYAAFRSSAARSQQASGQGVEIFDQRSDAADARAFMKRIDDPFLKRYVQTAKGYHCLFSIPRKPYKDNNLRWKDVVRDVMGQLEREMKVKLDYIAVVHDDPKHPHCHVILRSVAETRNGKKRIINFRPGQTPEGVRVENAIIARIKELTGQSLRARGVDLEKAWADRRQAARIDVGLLNRGFRELQRRIQANQRQIEQAQREADYEAEMEARRKERGGR